MQNEAGEQQQSSNKWMGPKLRIATYNVHKCRGLDHRVRPARISQVLRELDADVIALQEVVRVEDRSERDQARFIASELGLEYCLGENRRLFGGAYGNVLLSRFPLREIRNHDITAGKRERRGCLRAAIDIGIERLHLFNIHSGTGFFERRQQARMLVSPNILLDPELRGARIVLGEF